MKKIIWHLGFRKTGTTSIQYLLDQIPRAAHPDLFISSRDGLTQPWREQVVRATRSGTRPDPSRLRAEMARVAERLRQVDQDRILISDENLFAFSLFGRDGRHFFDWAADILPLIETEFADFDNVFVAYTRPLEAWLKSSYAQEVKRGRTWRSLAAWRARVPASCNWDDGIARIRAAIRSPLVLLAQSEDLDAGLPLGARLLEMAGLPPAAIRALGPAPRLNESLSPANMRLLRLFNLFGLNGLIRIVINRRARARELARHQAQTS